MSETRKAVSVPGAVCECIVDWEPFKQGREPTYCRTEAHWRYPTMGGGHMYMYLCDEHGIPHLDFTEPVDAREAAP